MARTLLFLGLLGLASLATADVGTVTFVESVPLGTEAYLDLPDLPQAPDVWLDLVRGARTSLDIFSFYVSPDPDRPGPLRAVLDAAEARARDGVEVRLLIDAKFARTYPETHERWSALPHMQSRLLDCEDVWGSGVLHAKGMIIDGRRFFLGSQNWDWRALVHIHELGVVVEQHDLAADLERIYAVDWAYAGGEEIPPLADDVSDVPDFAPVRRLALPDGRVCDAVLAASPPRALPAGVPWDLPLLIDQIDNATTRVRLQMLSYNPGERDGGYWDVLDAALRRADARGCEVQIILSNWSKRHFMVPYIKSLSVLPHTEVRFTNIPEWSGGFIPFARVEHAKYVTCDGQAVWLGTSNGSRDYFEQSRNISLFLRGAGAADAADRFFEASWLSPYAETVDACAEYEPPRRQ
ncbi:MAG: phospholipase D-like domain-containing protein [Candidatus Krumholzibacteriia bacterium]